MEPTTLYHWLTQFVKAQFADFYDFFYKAHPSAVARAPEGVKLCVITCLQMT